MNRLNTLSRVVALALVVAAPLASAAGPTRLLAPAAGDQVPGTLSAAKAAAVVADLDRTPVQFSWALDPAERLAAPAPFVRESREYWDEVSAQGLAKGIAINTTAPGALVRFSPIDGAGSAKALVPSQLVIRKDGRELTRGAAFASWANGPDLKAAGADFPTGTAIFRLDEKLGAGRFEVSMPKAAGGWLVHVFEPGSGEVMTLTTDRNNVLDGDTLRVTARYDSTSKRKLSQVAGVATSPEGRIVDLAFKKQVDGSFVADMKHAASGNANGLWEVHTFATTADGAVQRDAKTAFASSPATARFTGSATVDVDAKARVPGVAVSVGVEAARASRYDVSAVLYATNAAGALVPAAIAHSAAFLQPGAKSLQMRFASDTLAAHGLGAPYEVRDLTLTDQGALAQVERRTRALVIE